MMKRQIIIEDGKIHLVESKAISSIPVEEFAKLAITGESEFETKQLPINCAKYICSDKFEAYIQHIPSDNYRLNFKGKLYITRWPHTILYFKFKRNTISLIDRTPLIFWTRDRHLDLEEGKFFVPPLHNIYNDGRICEGSPIRDAKTQRDYIVRYMLNLFNTEYNTDLSSGKRYMDTVCRDQHNLVKQVKDKHDLIQLWWKPLIKNDEDALDEYRLGRDSITLKERLLKEWLEML